MKGYTYDKVNSSWKHAKSVCECIYINDIHCLFTEQWGPPFRLLYELHDITVTMITLCTTHQKL